MRKYLFVVVLGAMGAMGMQGCSASKETPAPPKALKGQDALNTHIQEQRRERALRHFIEGSSLDAKENYAEAILEYQEALALDPNAAIYYAISRDYAHLGRHVRAAEMGREAVKLEPNNIAYRENLASVYLAAFQQDLAIREYEAVVALDSHYVAGWYNLARLYQSSKPLRALEIYEMLLEREGDDWDLLLQSAELNNGLGRYKEAADRYSRMLGIDPGNKALQRTLAETYGRAGEYDKAVEMLEGMMEVDPNDQEVAVNLADVYLDRREFTKAITLFESLLKSGKANSELKLRVGVAYFGQIPNDSTFIPKAREVFEQVRIEIPDDWRPYWYLGAVASNEKKDSLAARYFERVTQIAEWNGDAWWLLGSHYFEKGDFTRLLEVMERARKALPKDHRIYLLQGLAYSRMEKNLEAMSMLEKAYELNPKDMNTLSTLALTYDGMERYEDSDRLYEEALKIDANSALILNNYSYSMAEREVQLERALAMATKAVEAEPENDSYLDTLGWIYFKLGNYKEAEAYIAKAVATGSASAVVHEHLGDIMYKLGDQERAMSLWQKALEMSVKNDVLKQKIERGTL